MPVVIVLAAGRGTRFRASGGTGSKLQADLYGKPVLTHVLAAVEHSGLAVHVVHRACGDGMSDSIAEGVRATPAASGWLVLPGDLPVGDGDGVLAIRAGEAEALADKVRAIESAEARILEQIAQGTLDRAWVDTVLKNKGVI